MERDFTAGSLSEIDTTMALSESRVELNKVRTITLDRVVDGMAGINIRGTIELMLGARICFLRLIIGEDSCPPSQSS